MKKLTVEPAWPLYSSITKVGAIPKHNVVPIPLVIARIEILKISKRLVK